MNQALTPQQVYDELDLGSPRGGKAGINRPQLEVTVVRGLTEADLPSILAPPPVSQPNSAIQSIRHSHHKLAQLIAEGKQGAEIALVTGYSQSYLSKLQGDPAFEELVTYYAEQRKSIFVDAQERLKAIGVDATEKLHERLHDPTELWTKKDLMDVIKMALPAETGSGVKLAPNAGQGTGPGSNFTLNVKFVGAGEAQISSGPGPLIDGQSTVLEGDSEA